MNMSVVNIYPCVTSAVPSCFLLVGYLPPRLSVSLELPPLSGDCLNIRLCILSFETQL